MQTQTSAYRTAGLAVGLLLALALKASPDVPSLAQMIRVAAGQARQASAPGEIAIRGGDQKVRASARLVRVVDGDTLHLEIETVPGAWQEFTCRLRRVDAPELPTRAGKKAKAEVETLLLRSKWRLTRNVESDRAKREYVSAILEVEAHGRDKYRRLLVELWADGKNVSDWLLEKKLAQAWPQQEEE